MSSGDVRSIKILSKKNSPIVGTSTMDVARRLRGARRRLRPSRTPTRKPHDGTVNGPDRLSGRFGPGLSRGRVLRGCSVGKDTFPTVRNPPRSATQITDCRCAHLHPRRRQAGGMQGGMMATCAIHRIPSQGTLWGSHETRCGALTVTQKFRLAYQVGWQHPLPVASRRARRVTTCVAFERREQCPQRRR